MESTVNILFTSIITSLGLGLSFFFGVIFLKNAKTQNRILGLLLIVMALRITKSIFYNYVELPLFVKNLGLAANLAVGPLLFLYGYYLVHTKTTFKKTQLIHLLPALVYTLGCTVMPNAQDSVFWTYSYSFILLQSYFYVGVSLYLYYKKMRALEKKVRLWCLRLTLVLAAIWAVYTLIFVGVLPVYASGSIAYSLLVVLLAYLSINKRKIEGLNILGKYGNSKLSYEEGKRYFDKMEHLLRYQKLYLQADLSLQTLAKAVGVSPRQVSEIINRFSGKNFANYINSYRVEEAKTLLKSTDKKSKIIGIALDSGFNNLSTFNVAFKADTDQTPSEYRAKFNQQLI